MAKGGRGGKRGRGGGGGGIGRPIAWSNTPNPYQIPENLNDAIGRKGAEMSMTDAYFDANPYYSDNYAEFSQNCQRCVMAYEMRRRGYDVEALPTYENDEMPRGGNWMTAFNGAQAIDVGKSTETATIKNIENQMKQFGDGSRAILRVKWAGGNSGHVVNLEYSNGKLYAYDAQSNSRLTNEAMLRDYLPYTTLSRTQLVRTDNLSISDNMKYMVRPAQNIVPKERRRQTSLIAG